MSDETSGAPRAVPKSPAPDVTTDDLERVRDGDPRMIVSLSTDGRLKAPQQASRQLLRERLQNAEVLPTGPGWAVFRTLGPLNAQAITFGQREVIAAGIIGETGISVIDFIAFVANGYSTGVLTVAEGEVERSTYFYKGDVVWASSTAPEDRLGEFLFRRGRITREQLQLAVRDSDKRIGRACVERGFLSAHELWSLVQAQLTVIFDKLLAAESGMWEFARLKSDTLAESQIHLPTQGLLVDALRRLDEMKRYRERIRSGDVLVQKTETDGEAAVARLGPDLQKEARELLIDLPAKATIYELMRIMGRGEFEVTRAVYTLLRAGVVEVYAPTEAVEGPPPEFPKTEAREMISIYSMAIREVFGELTKAGSLEIVKNAVDDFVKSDQTKGPLMSQVMILPDGTLDESSLITASESARLLLSDLSGALSELLFFVLFQATELLDPRRGDDLGRRVKMIHGMLARPKGESS